MTIALLLRAPIAICTCEGTSKFHLLTFIYVASQHDETLNLASWITMISVRRMGSYSCWSLNANDFIFGLISCFSFFIFFVETIIACVNIMFGSLNNAFPYYKHGI